MPRSKNQKRQTKLAFSPIAADSKHAHVLYDGSPAKRRRIEDYVQAQSMLTSDGPSSSALRATLTSPPRSSQAVARNRMPLTPQFGGDSHQRSSHKHELTASEDDTSSDSQAFNALRKTKTKSKGRIKESSKIFSQPTQSSPLNGRRSGAHNEAAAESSDDTLSSSASSSSDADELVPPSKSPAGKTRGSLPRPKVVELISSDDQRGEISDDDDDDDEDDVIPPSSIQRRSARRAQEATIDDESDESDEVRPAPSQRRSLRSSQKLLDHEDSEEIRPVSTQRASLRRSQKQLEPGYDDVARPTSPLGRTKRNTKDSPELEDSDDVLPSSSRGRRLARRNDASPSKRSRVAVSHDSEDADENIQSTRAKKSRENNEIDEEAEDLNEESTVFRNDGPSSSRPSKRDDRRRRLEQLKAKRAMRASPPVAVEDEDPEEGSEVPEQDNYEQANWNEEDEDEEDGFVIEDDGEAAAVSDDQGEIPEEMMALEFMRHANRSLKEHWFYVVEWLLQNRLNPGGSTAVEELYRKSVDKVNDKCAANIARLISSSWSSTFIRTLKARPDYNEAPWEGSGFLETAKCSACNRTGHVPRFQVTFTGKAYDKETLEPLKDEDDDDGDSVDENGFQITDENRDFKLGTFCRSNTINAHALVHWRMGLKDWVNAYLKGKGLFKSKRIVERAEWSQIKKSKLVESIMDDLRASGEIRRLWREFEQTVEAVPDVKGQNYRR